MADQLVKVDIKKRLNRIEGQIRGIQRMIDSDEGCNDILIQIAAVRAAINKVGGMILENYTKNCIKTAVDRDSDDKSVNDLIETMLKFIK